MKYLTGVVNEPVLAAIESEPDLGLMAQPRSNVARHVLPGYHSWAADNGAFGAWTRGEPFDFEYWAKWLRKLDAPHTALFAVVPDVVASHAGTAALWRDHFETVTGAGFMAAFALQNGCTRLAQVPDHARVVFIGGDTAYKLSNETARLVGEAKADGRWVHMGRVNSEKRWCRAVAMGCDSVDGTYIKHGPPQVMVDTVLSWIRSGRHNGGQREFLDLVGGSRV